MKVWGVGVAGCGNIAETVYIPQMERIPNARLVAVYDKVVERAKQLAEKFGIDRWYGDVDEFLADANVELVMSVGAIQGRHELNMKILKADKHLYSQKPFAPSVEAATEQIEEAKKRGLKLSTAPVHRNRPDLQYVRKLIYEKMIGHISLAYIESGHGGPEYFQYRDSDPSWFYQEGAGALSDVGIHGLDQLVALLGPAKWVSCTAAISEPVRVVRSGACDGMVIKSDILPDNYLISLDFGNGTLGLVACGFIKKASLRPGGQIDIYGDHGTIVLGGVAYEGVADIKLFVDKPEVGLRGWVDQMPTKDPKPTIYFQAMCISDLIDAIENDHPSNLSPEHARHVLEIIEAIPRSIEEKRAIELHTTF